MIEQFGVSRCHLNEHLKRKDGARNNALFINFLVIEVWIGRNLDVNDPPHANLAQQRYKSIELSFVRRFDLPSNYGKELVRE